MKEKIMALHTPIDDLQYSDEYAQYIMNNYDGSRTIVNGDTLLVAMEDGYLFDEFLASMDKTND